MIELSTEYRLAIWHPTLMCETFVESKDIYFIATAAVRAKNNNLAFRIYRLELQHQVHDCSEKVPTWCRLPSLDVIKVVKMGRGLLGNPKETPSD